MKPKHPPVAEMGMHVIVCGDEADGYSVVGPFKTGDAARRYVETDPELTPDNCQMVPLWAPARR